MSGEAEELDEFDALARARRRRTILIGGFVLAALAVGLAWWKLTGLPGLDREIEQDVREALPEIEKLPVDVRRSFAAQAIAELEHERLPAGLVEAFDDYDAAPPEYAGMLLLEPFAHDAEAREAWDLACPIGLAAIADGAAEGPRATFLRCDLGRLGLIEEAESTSASLGELVACHAAWAWLVDHHAETEIERRVLRMLMLGT